MVQAVFIFRIQLEFSSAQKVEDSTSDRDRCQQTGHDPAKHDEQSSPISQLVGDI